MQVSLYNSSHSPLTLAETKSWSTTNSYRVRKHYTTLTKVCVIKFPYRERLPKMLKGNPDLRKGKGENTYATGGEQRLTKGKHLLR